MIVSIVLGILTLAFALAAFRLAKGPTLPDRVIALDLIAVLAIMIIAANAVQSERPVFLDAGLVLAVLAFLSTVAFARYLEGRR